MRIASISLELPADRSSSLLLGIMVYIDIVVYGIKNTIMFPKFSLNSLILINFHQNQKIP